MNWASTAMMIIGAALLLSVIRLMLWRRAAAAADRTSTWRMAALIGLQTMAAGLLMLTLFPPTVATPTGALIVIIDDAPGRIQHKAGDIVVTLPEAAPRAGAARAPDLASALRRFPNAARVHVVGKGLRPRDQGPLGISLTFAPTPQRPGLIELSLPQPVAPGGRFTVGGQIGGLSGAVVELIDPAEVIVDQATLAADQRFTLSGQARVPGLALFTLRLRGTKGATLQEIAVPVQAREQDPPRILVLAGAPSAETKYLKRWAEDAGMETQVQIDIGAGVQLGDKPAPLTRATFDRFDMVVIDERRWETLSDGVRSALGDAIDSGLGVLLRPSGPLSDATRRDWAALGLPVTGGDNLLPVRLNADSTDEEAHDPITLERRDVTAGGARSLTLIRDAEGQPVSSWRGRGRGRIGVWPGVNSHRLALTGQTDRYDEIWSALVSTLGRPADDRLLSITGPAWTGSRLDVCGVTGSVRIREPDGSETQLIVDPHAGPQNCAAYWPEHAGWRSAIASQDDVLERETAFYVYDEDAAASLVQAANRATTLRMAGDAPRAALSEGAMTMNRIPTAPWPWFAALLASLAALWWLERRRRPT